MAVSMPQTVPTLDVLARRFREVRDRTEWLCAPLSAEA